MHDEALAMQQAGLSPVVYPLSTPFPSSAPCEVESVYESRKNGNIKVDVQESKGGDYVNLGYSELFGLVHAAGEAAERLRAPTTGVIVCSRVCGDAARLFAALIVSSAAGPKAAKLIKPRGSSTKPKAPHLKRLLDYHKAPDRMARMEAYYFTTLQSI